MQEVTVTVDPPTAERKFPIAHVKTVEFQKPYVFKDLTVQGVSPTRLTPWPNQNISVPDEVGKTIVARNLARYITGSEIAIAQVGLGLRPAARTVAVHVQAAIFFAGLARKVANSPSPDTLIPIPAPPSDEVDVDTSWQDLSDIDEDMDVEF